MSILATSLLLELQAEAQQAARAAGELIQAHRHKNIEVLIKDPNTSLAGQVVTEVDHKAQAVILERLMPGIEQYDLALLTEESPDDGSRFEKTAFWCIDPLDGTLPFTQGIAGFSVSIGLVARDGTPLIGVVYDPVDERLYSAVRGQGATLNHAPIAVPALDTRQPLILRTDVGFETHPWLDATLEGLQQLAQQLGMPGAEIRYRTGGALNACDILGTPHICYFKYPKNNKGGSLWDYAASACVYAETAMSACDIFGQPMDLNRRDSTYMNHKGILFSSDPRISKGVLELYQRLAAELGSCEEYEG